MHLAKSIDGPIIYTQFEPIEDDEWAEQDSIAQDSEDEDGFWVAIFMIQKESVARFVDELEETLENLIEVSTVDTLSISRYAYVVAAIRIEDLNSNIANDAEDKVWMVCMRLSQNYLEAGCTLFAPKAFLAFNRTLAEKLLLDCAHIDISYLKK